MMRATAELSVRYVVRRPLPMRRASRHIWLRAGFSTYRYSIWACDTYYLLQTAALTMVFYVDRLP